MRAKQKAPTAAGEATLSDGGESQGDVHRGRDTVPHARRRLSDFAALARLCFKLPRVGMAGCGPSTGRPSKTQKTRTGGTCRRDLTPQVAPLARKRGTVRLRHLCACICMCAALRARPEVTWGEGE